MKRTFILLVLAVALPAAVAAQQNPANSPKPAKTSRPATQRMSGDKGAVLAVIREFEHDFNTGDPGWMKLCADQTSIIDEFPPYAWSGSNTCKQWGDDYAADAQKNGVTEPSVMFGHPRHLDVSGDRAYVVMPAQYNYKQNAKPVKEVGATITIALQKTPAGWRIASWAWSRG